MAKKPLTDDVLAEDVNALATTLTKAVDDDANNLGKALDVAVAALTLDKSTTKSKKSKKNKLAKATGDDDDKQDDDEDEDEETKERSAWIKKLLKEDGDGKAAGEQMFAEDREDTGTAAAHMNAGGESRGMAKALAHLAEEGIQAVDVSNYLTQELRIRDKEQRTVRRLRKENATLFKALMTMRKEQRQAVALQDQALGTICKALKGIYDRFEGFDSQPARGSKFAGMEKSIAAVKATMEANGGKQIPYSKDRAAQALQKGLISNEQHAVWKKTGMLPAGVDLN